MDLTAVNDDGKIRPSNEAGRRAKAGERGRKMKIIDDSHLLVENEEEEALLRGVSNLIPVENGTVPSPGD